MFQTGVQAAPQSAEREVVPGVVNYTRVDGNLAYGGATKPEALTELKSRGFKSVINLRQANEPGANVEAEGVAARTAGLKYINLPFIASDPNAATLVELFLKAVVDPSNVPVFVHSGLFHRAAGMLLIKRVLIDGWSVDKAAAEADAALADGTPGAKRNREFALDYIKTHSK